MVPSSEHILLLSDFNVRVGADQESWPSVLGHHGIGKMNDNSQRLLELCCYHNLRVTNTFFKNKACHKVSWRHPMSKHWHQLDLVITRRDSLNNVCNTRSYHRADCNTDHSLIASRVKLTPKKIYHSKQMYHHEQSAKDKWSSLRKTIYSAALLIFGKREQRKEEHICKAKCNALVDYKRHPSQKNLLTLRAARNKAPRTARRCGNRYLLQL